MKRVVTILLSLFLVYGGVAWAMATCLRHHDHPDHLSEDHSIHFHGSVSSESPQDQAEPVIHCPFSENQIGPTVPSRLTKLRRTDGVTSIQALFFRISASVTFRDSLWLEAVFRGILTFPYPENLGRHLFLSVMRI